MPGHGLDVYSADVKLEQRLKTRPNTRLPSVPAGEGEFDARLIRFAQSLTGSGTVPWRREPP